VLTQGPVQEQVETAASAIRPAGARVAGGRSRVPGRGTGQRQCDAVEGLPTGAALLEMRCGPAMGGRFLLDQEVVTVGRHPDSDILFDDVTVSRLHAEFRREIDGFSVHDVGSLNGTYVNHRPIVGSPLACGDEVQIGKFELTYLSSRAPTDELV
jgi:hypothetical protein